MGNAATGVTVVTTDGPHGRYGQTVSAMCPVSADPPALLVCVTVRSPLPAAARGNGVLAVSVLAAVHRNFGWDGPLERAGDSAGLSDQVLGTLGGSR